MRARLERIRTVGECDFAVILLETNEQPLYQRIAKEVLRLRQLKLTRTCIAETLRTDRKSVYRALRWIKKIKNLD